MPLFYGVSEIFLRPRKIPLLCPANLYLAYSSPPETRASSSTTWTGLRCNIEDGFVVHFAWKWPHHPLGRAWAWKSRIRFTEAICRRRNIQFSAFV